MSRTLLSVFGQFCFVLILAVAASLLALALACESLAAARGGPSPPPEEEHRRSLPLVGTAMQEMEGSESRRHRPDAHANAPFRIQLADSVHGDGGDRASENGPTILHILPTHVTILIHGVEDDGKGWSLRFKDALAEGRPGNAGEQVYLLRWTQPDGSVPDLAHARNSLAAIEQRIPDHPEREAGYQVGVAGRLRDFLANARTLFAQHGVDGKIDVVAHSQGSLIALKALDLGGEADNVVFLGSPLQYAGDRQDDVVQALPHVRGVLYNYYARNDVAIRFMGGGLFFREPCGWPAQDLPSGKVVQTCLNVDGHTGYYTAEAIRTNYLDKVGAQAGEVLPSTSDRAEEFAAKWRKLTEAAGLIDPE